MQPVQTRWRKSCEYGFALCSPRNRTNALDSLIDNSLGIQPDSTPAETLQDVAAYRRAAVPHQQARSTRADPC